MKTTFTDGVPPTPHTEENRPAHAAHVIGPSVCQESASGVGSSPVPTVLNALQVLERMDYQPGDRVLVENFLRILGERGMWIIDATLRPYGVNGSDTCKS